MHNSRLYAEVAKLGQRRWDEVPVLNGSQVQILPSAPLQWVGFHLRQKFEQKEYSA